MPKFNLKPFSRKAPSTTTEQEDRYVLVCMPVEKADRLENIFAQLTDVFQPDFRVVRLEKIPGDWVATLRDHIRRSSLICFDVSRVGGDWNPHVLRELYYVNTLLLDLQTERDLPSTFVFMHRDEQLADLPTFSFQSAYDIDPILCEGDSRDYRRNLVGKRSVCVFDYDNANAAVRFGGRLTDLKDFITPPERPPLYNHVFRPHGKQRHPVLKAKADATVFIPYCLRDEQYDGFALACASMATEQDPHFWDEVGRVFRFSWILRHYIELWLDEPRLPRSAIYGLLCAFRSAMDQGWTLAYRGRLEEMDMPDAACRKLLDDILSAAESEKQSRNEASQDPFEPLKPVSYPAQPQSAPDENVEPDLVSVTVPSDLGTAIQIARNPNWESFFRLNQGPIHDAIARNEFIESRYFTVSGTDHAGIFEDTLDGIGSDIRQTVRRMLACGYTDDQAEQAVRAAIVLRTATLVFKSMEQRDLLREGISATHKSNLLSIIWDEGDLHRFEFQSSSTERVIRTYIPWNSVRERVMRHAAREAAATIDVPYEEMYAASFRDVELPPAQIWGILLTTKLLDLIEADELRDWWVKFAIPEYLQSGRHEQFIVDPMTIDRWAPKEYA